MAVPESCKSCAHRLNDIAEGHLCMKVHRKIHLPNGDILEWPGFSVSEAIKECAGVLAQPSITARLRYAVSM